MALTVADRSPSHPAVHHLTQPLDSRPGVGFDPAARRPTGPAPRQTLIAPTNSSSQLQWWQGQGCAKTGEPQDSRPTGRIARQSIPSVGTSQPTSGKRAFP